MKLFSFFRFFVGDNNDESIKQESRSNESQERRRSFFLEDDRPTRAVDQSEQTPASPRKYVQTVNRQGAENQKVFSFFRPPGEQGREDGQTNRASEKPRSFFETDRLSRPGGRSEQPIPTRRFGPQPDQYRGSRSAETARPLGGNTQMLLEELKNLDPGILIVFITSNEGRLAEHTMASYAEKVRIGASSAISLAVARRESTDLRLGDAKELRINSDKGLILLLSLGVKGVLTVVANQDANTDLILEESYRVANQLMVIR